MKWFYGKNEILKRLPKYQRERIVDVYCTGENYHWEMAPNPSDTLQEPVYGISYSIKDLRYNIDDYLERNMRLGWDY